MRIFRKSVSNASYNSKLLNASTYKRFTTLTQARGHAPCRRPLCSYVTHAQRATRAPRASGPAAQQPNSHQSVR